MAEQQNDVVQFPASNRQRRRILRQTEDKRLRAAAFLRSLFGWLFVLSLILFSIEHFSIFRPDTIQRIMGYAVAGLRSSDGDKHTIAYPGGVMNDAELFGVGIAYVDSDTLYVSGPGGLNQLTYQHSYGDPVVETSDSMILIYDRGGKSAMLANALAPVASVKLDSPIITGAIGKNGGFVIVTDESGYKTALTVFDDKGTQVFKWSTSEYNIMSAAIAPDGKGVCALAFRQNGLTMESHILFFAYGADAVQSDINLGDSLGYEIQYLTGSMVAAVTDNGVYLTDGRGEAAKAYAYASNELSAYAFDEGRVALSLRSYTGTAKSEAVLIDEKTVSRPFALQTEVSSLDLSGRYLGVQSASGLALYDTEGALLAMEQIPSGARRVLMKSDGTAVVLYGKHATLMNYVK